MYIGCLFAFNLFVWIYLYGYAYLLSTNLLSMPEKTMEYTDVKTGDQLNVLKYNLLMKPEKGCMTSTFLIIFIHVRAGDEESRRVIRETWPDENISKPYKLFFMTGTEPNLNLTQELLQHQDLIQYDFIDSFQNLTLKTIACLQFAMQYCASAKYFLKVDTDVSVYLPSLISLLEEKQPKRTVYGKLILNEPVQRNGKWAVSKDMIDFDTYPDYVGGSCYMITMDLAADLLVAADETKPWWPVEDAFVTGHLREMCGGLILGVERWLNRMHCSEQLRAIEPLCRINNNVEMFQVL